MPTSNHGWYLLAAVSLVQPALGPDSAAAEGSIYRCETADGVTFSDRPCDAAAEIYEAGAYLNTYEAPDIVSSARVTPAARVHRRDSEPDAKARAKLLEHCQRIQQSLREIRSKMRAGYTAKEGERLRVRESKLREQRSAAKCRR